MGHARSSSLYVAFAALLAGAVVFEPQTAESGGRRHRRTSSELSAPVGGSQGGARGRIVARRARGQRGRESLTVEIRGLNRPGRYSVAFDDPSIRGTNMKRAADVRVGRGRRGRVVLSSGGPVPLPDHTTLADLAGARVEVRDDAGRLVLSGAVPTAESTTAPDGCRFVEEVVLEDLFDGGTVGSAPADWEVAGTDVAGIEVAVDDTVFDGASGASVRLADTVAADPGSPSMARGFTAQGGHFFVEFVLVSGDAAGRTVFQISDSTADPDAVPTGLGEGLGFYEDGTIGFGVGDSLGTAAASTQYHFRVDFDIAAGTFDVAIDGTSAVAGRALGFSGTTLDRISFAGTPSTTGTAWVDTVRVTQQTLDCMPTANAGPDQVVESTLPATAVTLDGSLSADPEGATLTYTWTGDFAEGTATGANPTVHFSGLGSHEVTLVVNDGFFDSAPDTVAIEIADTTPPELTVTGLPTEIWPPNHQLHTLAPTVTATDSGSEVTVALEITSNEADNGLGDGNTTGDWAIRSPSDFDLRAERSGPGSGRIYTLRWTATDAAGNATTFEGQVRIPHDRGNGGGRGNGRGPK